MKTELFKEPQPDELLSPSPSKEDTASMVGAGVSLFAEVRALRGTVAQLCEAVRALVAMLKEKEHGQTHNQLGS